MNRHFLFASNANICAIMKGGFTFAEGGVQTQMLHHKAFRFRLYPTTEQIILIRQM
ncbi:helix-turn-helix domain-containing protein, partial [Cohnella sp.]|uniref:helix-turn-helix domain-containing protein n=1 Tax=Cohnella sp. TaxID=1883426 RepID=UPI0035676506